jgi:3-oxoacyl-[acyl-carrier protein] reductase
MGILKTLKRKFLRFNNSFSKDLEISNENIIITGANSGIGYQLVKILSDFENNILAFVNYKDNNIINIKNESIKIIKCDFSNPENINGYSQEIKNFKPNILINCAAVFGSENQNFSNINTKEFSSVLNINVLSPFVLIQKSLKANCLKQIINISSLMGSMSDNTGDYYLYKGSKTLLNSITKNLSFDLNQNINIFCLHPGDVKTKMNTGGLISAEIAAQKIINICSQNNLNYRGKFIDNNGKVLSW